MQQFLNLRVGGYSIFLVTLVFVDLFDIVIVTKIVAKVVCLLRKFV